MRLFQYAVIYWLSSAGITRCAVAVRELQWIKKIPISHSKMARSPEKPMND